jgi:hypothetical protein
MEDRSGPVTRRVWQVAGVARRNEALWGESSSCDAQRCVMVKTRKPRHPPRLYCPSSTCCLANHHRSGTLLYLRPTPCACLRPITSPVVRSVVPSAPMPHRKTCSIVRKLSFRSLLLRFGHGQTLAVRRSDARKWHVNSDTYSRCDAWYAATDSGSACPQSSLGEKQSWGAPLQYGSPSSTPATASQSNQKCRHSAHSTTTCRGSLDER